MSNITFSNFPFPSSSCARPRRHENQLRPLLSKSAPGMRLVRRHAPMLSANAKATQRTSCAIGGYVCRGEMARWQHTNVLRKNPAKVTLSSPQPSLDQPQPDGGFYFTTLLCPGPEAEGFGPAEVIAASNSIIATLSRQFPGQETPLASQVEDAGEGYRTLHL